MKRLFAFFVLLGVALAQTQAGPSWNPNTLTLGTQNVNQGTLTLAGSAATAGQLILTIAGATANASTVQPGVNTGATTFTLPIGTSTATTLVGATAALTNHGLVLGAAGGYAQTTSNISSTSGTIFNTYNSETTAGLGIPYVRGVASQTNQTTTAATLLTVTPAASVGTYRACVTVSVSAATSGVIGWTLSWTDSNGNAQSNIAQSLFQQGTAAPASTFTTSAAGNYDSCHEFDVNSAAAAITVKWVGGGTTTAKVSAVVERKQ